MFKSTDDISYKGLQSSLIKYETIKKLGRMVFGKHPPLPKNILEEKNRKKC